MLSSLITLLKKVLLSFQQSQCQRRGCYYCKQSYVFICSHFIREKRFNYFPEFFIIINVLYKVAIMSFLAFGTTVTLLIRHNGYVAHPAQRLRFSFYALLFSSDLKQRNLFLNLDLVIISLLSSFVIKGAWFALTYFFSGGACQSSDFLHASRKPIRSSFGMLLLDNS